MTTSKADTTWCGFPAEKLVDATTMRSNLYDYFNDEIEILTPGGRPLTRQERFIVGAELLDAKYGDCCD